MNHNEYTGSISTLTLDRGLHASAEQHHTALVKKRLIKFGVKCMNVYYNMLNVTKHAYISSCLNDADASRAWGDIQLTTLMHAGKYKELM